MKQKLRKQQKRKTKSQLFAKINKIDKNLARFINKRGGPKSIKLGMNRLQQNHGNTKDHKRILQGYYMPIRWKMDNQKKMDTFLERYNLPGLNQEEIEDMNRLITNTKIESMI